MDQTDRSEAAPLRFPQESGQILLSTGRPLPCSAAAASPAKPTEESRNGWNLYRGEPLSGVVVRAHPGPPGVRVDPVHHQVDVLLGAITSLPFRVLTVLER